MVIAKQCCHPRNSISCARGLKPSNSHIPIPTHSPSCPTLLISHFEASNHKTLAARRHALISISLRRNPPRTTRNDLYKKGVVKTLRFFGLSAWTTRKNVVSKFWVRVRDTRLFGCATCFLGVAKRFIYTPLRIVVIRMYSTSKNLMRQANMDCAD